MDQVGGETSYNFSRGSIRRRDRIQRLGLTALSNDKSAAILADLVVGELYVLAALRRLWRRRCKTREAAGKQKGEQTTQTMHIGFRRHKFSD